MIKLIIRFYQYQYSAKCFFPHSHNLSSSFKMKVNVPCLLDLKLFAKHTLIRLVSSFPLTGESVHFPSILVTQLWKNSLERLWSCSFCWLRATQKVHTNLEPLMSACIATLYHLSQHTGSPFIPHASLTSLSNFLLCSHSHLPLMSQTSSIFLVLRLRLL